MSHTPLAFTAEQAARLAEVSLAQVRRWSRIGLYRPEFAEQDLYSFRDVVALRTIGILRSRHRIPVHGRAGLVAFGEWLRERRAAPWSSLRFCVAGRELMFREPETGRLVSSGPAGQIANGDLFDVVEVETAVRKAAELVMRRSEEQLGKTERRRGIQGGGQVVAGTRIRTASIYEFHQAGYRIEQILNEYPNLTRSDVEEAIHFEKRRRRAA